MRGSIEVHRYLTERQIPHEFYRLEHALRRLDEAAALLGLRQSQVVASEMFEAKRGSILALTPAGKRPSAAAVAQAAGENSVRAATPSRATTRTGFLASWLPPVGHERASRVVLDASLATLDVLYAAGGDPGVMLVIRATDLIRATSASIAELAVPAGSDAADVPVSAPDPSLLAG
ncbi:MAG TPA: YbaK/EbsC family protein [Actinomycetota bacterium]|nr:YbaK/EbsC family protein [Actinomycetota bacterium]